MPDKAFELYLEPEPSGAYYVSMSRYDSNQPDPDSHDARVPDKETARQIREVSSVIFWTFDLTQGDASSLAPLMRYLVYRHPQWSSSFLQNHRAAILEQAAQSAGGMVSHKVEPAKGINWLKEKLGRHESNTTHKPMSQIAQEVSREIGANVPANAAFQESLNRSFETLVTAADNAFLRDGMPEFQAAHDRVVETILANFLKTDEFYLARENGREKRGEQKLSDYSNVGKKSDHFFSYFTEYIVIGSEYKNLPEFGQLFENLHHSDFLGMVVNWILSEKQKSTASRIGNFYSYEQSEAAKWERMLVFVLRKYQQTHQQKVAQHPRLQAFIDSFQRSSIVQSY